MMSRFHIALYSIYLLAFGAIFVGIVVCCIAELVAHRTIPWQFLAWGPVFGWFAWTARKYLLRRVRTVSE